MARTGTSPPGVAPPPDEGRGRSRPLGRRRYGATVSRSASARGSTPEEFAKFLRHETEKWTDVMQKANIKVQGE